MKKLLFIALLTIGCAAEYDSKQELIDKGDISLSSWEDGREYGFDECIEETEKDIEVLNTLLDNICNGDNLTENTQAFCDEFKNN